MARGSFVAGLLAGFALSTAVVVVLDRPTSPAAPDARTHEMLGRILELLERIERRESTVPIAPQSAPVRQPAVTVASDDATLAQLLAAVRSIGDRIDQQRLVSEIVPASMDVGAVRASIDLGELDSALLQSQLLMMSSRDVLQRLGRPSGIDTSHGCWTYATPEGEGLTLFFAGGLVSDVTTRVDRAR